MGVPDMPCRLSAALPLCGIHDLEDPPRIQLWLWNHASWGTFKFTSAHQYLWILHRNRSDNPAGNRAGNFTSFLSYSSPNCVHSWSNAKSEGKYGGAHVTNYRSIKLEFKIYEVCLDTVWFGHIAFDGSVTNIGNRIDHQIPWEKRSELSLDLFSYNWLASVYYYRFSFLQSRKTAEKARQHKVRIRLSLYKTKTTKNSCLLFP